MKTLITCFIFITCSLVSFGQKSFTGRAVNVSDGDTFTLLLSDNTTIRVRLYGIDCPEKGQDFGNVAKEFAKKCLTEKVITVEQKDVDRYGRVVGIVYYGDNKQPLNEDLLIAGLAWHYAYYDHNPKWAAYAETAKQEGKGLWQQSNAIAPWEFRKAERIVSH